MVHVTGNAIMRYQERIENLPAREVVAALDTRAVRAAAEMGSADVRLGSGHRIIVRSKTVITILPPRKRKRIHQERG